MNSFNLVLLSVTVFIVVLPSIDGKQLPLYNDDIVYYDECRITVSPKNYLQPVRAFAQIQRPCNGTLLWSFPNLYLTLTLVNLENETFTVCFDGKAVRDGFVRSIKHLDLITSEQKLMENLSNNESNFLCAKSNENRVSVIVEAQPLFAGVYLNYAMFNQRHPWKDGSNGIWERSEKYLYGPQEKAPMRKKKIRPNRKVSPNV